MTDPRTVTLAYVHKAGRLAATLRRTATGVEFRYDDAYLSDGGRPVAHSLPTEAVVVTPGRSVPAYLAGLLPEGRRLTALRRNLKASAEDELSLLVAIGGDPVGDVTVGTGIEPPPLPDEERADEP